MKFPWSIKVYRKKISVKLTCGRNIFQLIYLANISYSWIIVLDIFPSIFEYHQILYFHYLRVDMHSIVIDLNTLSIIIYFQVYKQPTIKLAIRATSNKTRYNTNTMVSIVFNKERNFVQNLIRLPHNFIICNCKFGWLFYSEGFAP